MEQNILRAITEGAQGVTINVSAADLKEIVAGIVRSEQQRTAEAEARAAERGTITREEAARALHVSINTLYRWSKSGYLRPVKVGTKVLYKNSDINEILTTKKK